MSLRFVCLACENEQAEPARCSVCASTAVVDLRPDDEVDEGDEDEGFSLRALDAAPIRLVAAAGGIGRALGGSVARGSPILVTGRPHSGKTTEVARLCASLPKAERIRWVDREMGDSLLSALFQRAELDPARVRLVDGGPAAVVALLRRGRAVVVIDSLSKLVPNEGRQVAFLSKVLEAARQSGAIPILIHHENKSGHVRGDNLLEAFVDAFVSVEKERFVPSKCRWFLIASGGLPREHVGADRRGGREAQRHKSAASRRR
jgi:predicted ATP-dependent serine protease